MLRCPSCATEVSENSLAAECPNCGALLDLAFSVGADPDRVKTFTERRAHMVGWQASGVWRYRELVAPSLSPDQIVSIPEGNTPLIESERIGAFAGLSSILVKHEGMNPTGSFKDRGMTVAMSQAKRLGARAVACASTGNTSASLAAYASIAGIPGVVLIPEGKISTGKLSQTLAHGAKTIQVRGTFDDCLRLLREASSKAGVYVVNSVNPFRLAGQRSIVFEMLHQLDWKAPDWIALPAGNLGNTSAFGDALRVAREAGLIDRLPRVLAVQAAGAAPFAKAFADHFKSHPTVQPETVATAIRIGAPASWDRAIRTITETHGAVVAVTDSEIMAAKREIDRAGVGCEPASAASVAGVRRLAAEGTIAPGERVVCVLTGHLLKDPDANVVGAESPVVIEPSVDAFVRAIT
jgi:threonine synthase